jgi:hypothetical protein
MATQHSNRDPKPSPRRRDVEKSNENKKTKPDLSATGIVKLAKQGLTLFHTPGRESFARLWVNDHWETHPVKSPVFEQWLFAMCYHQYGVVPSQRAVTAARSVLAADALFAGDEKPVYVRVAGHGEAIYIDLANDSRESVKITAEGWEVVPHVPVNFWRPRGMQALPRPKKGGTIADLRPFLNLASEDDWILSVSWLVGALRPDGPFPIMILQGAHGSAKSTVARVLRALVDPNIAPLRAESTNARDLMISAKNAWCLGYDNLSSLYPSLCDALCRLCTGGGFSTRELFTDDGEKIFEGMRPVLLNGIDIGIERPDLLDRAINLSLPPISDAARETEAKFWARFEAAQPYILGSLFDVVACALRRLPDTRPANLPRMADFATWICAAGPALGWPEGLFLTVYQLNIEESNAQALEASSLVDLIVRVAERGPWTGTATELLGVLLNEQLNDIPGLKRAYPRTPRLLSQAIRRLVPSLSRAGITIEFSRTPGTNSERMISIRKVGDGATLATQPA